MRTMTQGLLALGIVGAMAVSTPMMAKAQQIVISDPGVDVENGNRPDSYRNYRRSYREFDNYYAFGRRTHTQRYYNDGYGYSAGYGYSGYRRSFDVR